MTGRNSTKDTPFLKGLIVDAAQTAPSFRQACIQAGVPYSTGVQWKNQDEEFGKAVAAARDEYRETLRETAHERAVSGWERVVFHKGEPVWKRDPKTGEIMLDEDFNPIPWTEKVVSDRILERVMEANVPEYAKKSSLEVSGPNGGSIPTEIKVTLVKSDGNGKRLHPKQEEEEDPDFLK